MGEGTAGEEEEAGARREPGRAAPHILRLLLWLSILWRGLPNLILITGGTRAVACLLLMQPTIPLVLSSSRAMACLLLM